MQNAISTTGSACPVSTAEGETEEEVEQEEEEEVEDRRLLLLEPAPLPILPLSLESEADPENDHIAMFLSNPHVMAEGKQESEMICKRDIHEIVKFYNVYNVVRCWDPRKEGRLIGLGCVKLKIDMFL